MTMEAIMIFSSGCRKNADVIVSGKDKDNVEQSWLKWRSLYSLLRSSIYNCLPVILVKS